MFQTCKNKKNRLLNEFSKWISPESELCHVPYQSFYICYFPLDIAFGKKCIYLKHISLQKKSCFNTCLFRWVLNFSFLFFKMRLFPTKPKREERLIPKFTRHIRRYTQYYAFLGYRALVTYNKYRISSSHQVMGS